MTLKEELWKTELPHLAMETKSVSLTKKVYLLQVPMTAKVSFYSVDKKREVLVLAMTLGLLQNKTSILKTLDLVNTNELSTTTVVFPFRSGPSTKIRLIDTKM